MFLIENKLQELHNTFITPKNCFLKKPFLQEDQKEFDEIIASLRKETKTIEARTIEKIADNNYQNYLWLSKIFLEEELTIRNLIYSLKMKILSIEDYFITNNSYIRANFKRAYFSNHINRISLNLFLGWAISVYRKTMSIKINNTIDCHRKISK